MSDIRQYHREETNVEATINVFRQILNKAQQELSEKSLRKLYSALELEIASAKAD